MKINNEHKVLKEILITDGISRAELSRTLKLNKATTSYLIERLENNNIVTPRKELKKTNGRYSVLYELNKDYSKILSINIKPNEVFAYITDLHGNCIEEFSYGKRLDNETDLKNTLVDIIKSTTSDYSDIIGIGIAIHGLVNNDFIIKLAPNNNLANIDIKNFLQKAYPDYSFYIENEANISALGESKALDEKTTINVTNSHGIGCGIIVDYKIYRGSDGLAGEIGHTIVEPNGLLCSCGNRGCLEQYASEDNLCDQASKIKNFKITPIKFVSLFLEGDEDIKKLYYKSLDYLSISLHNVILLLNPSTLVLTGYLYSNIEDTIPYLESKLNTNITKINNYFVSDLEQNSIILGFTKLIVHNYFLKEMHGYFTFGKDSN